MASYANPLVAQYPTGMNPTGAQVSVPGGSTTNSSGANTLLPASGVGTSVSSPVTNNPYSGGAVPGATSGTPAPLVPSPGINSGGYTSSGGGALPNTGTGVGTNTGTGANTSANQSMIGGMTPLQFQNLYKDLDKTFGPGLAGTISTFLQSGAGYNQQAISNLLASLQPGIERGEESLVNQFSASGNRFGSGAQIGLADYESQVNLNEGSLISQMYEQAVQNYMNILGGTETAVANTKAHQPSVWDEITGGLDLAGSLGGAAAAGAGASGAGAGALAALAAL